MKWQMDEENAKKENKDVDTTPYVQLNQTLYPTLDKEKEVLVKNVYKLIFIFLFLLGSITENNRMCLDDHTAHYLF